MDDIKRNDTKYMTETEPGREKNCSPLEDTVKNSVGSAA